VKIVVCIKQVPATGADKRYTDDLRLDRTGVEAIINPLDEYAIEQALRLADDGSADAITYLSMGPEQASEALRRALAMGGDDAVLVTDRALAGADEWATFRRVTFPLIFPGILAAALLAFAGVKMLISDVVHLDVWLSLGIIVAILGASIVFSLVVTRDHEVPDAPPPEAG